MPNCHCFFHPCPSPECPRARPTARPGVEPANDPTSTRETAQHVTRHCGRPIVDPATRAGVIAAMAAPYQLRCEIKAHDDDVSPPRQAAAGPVPRGSDADAHAPIAGARPLRLRRRPGDQLPRPDRQGLGGERRARLPAPQHAGGPPIGRAAAAAPHARAQAARLPAPARAIADGQAPTALSITVHTG